jgi:hypothetical protein
MSGMRILAFFVSLGVVASGPFTQAVPHPKVGVQLNNLDSSYRSYFDSAATKIYGELANADFAAVNMKRCGCDVAIDGKKNSIIFHAVFSKADYPKLRLGQTSVVQLGYLDSYLYYVGAIRSWAATLAVMKGNYNAATSIQKVALIVALHEAGSENNTIVIWGDKRGNGYAFATQLPPTKVGGLAQPDADN